MSDEDGLLQEETYDFNIKNTGDAPAKYDLKLINEVPSTYTGKVLDTKYIKIGLEINGTEYGPMSLEKVKNVIDSDIIYKKEMINFKMRIWLDKTKEKDIENLEDYKAFLKLKIEATQRPESMDSGATKIFNYTGKPEEYTVPRDGYYYIEMAGAQGGASDTSLSLGAKTSGYIELKAGEKLYFYVGKQGTSPNTNCRSTGYEFNGGGIAKPGQITTACGGTGGGATDVRLVSGNWDDTSSLISRIMVAGAGGGPIGSAKYNCPHGGTLYGLESIYADYQSYLGNPGTQTSGGAAPPKFISAVSNGTAGSFGKGGYGGGNGNMASTDRGGGGGGGSGYYGGSGASGLSNGLWPGGGGSSYISGYAGVNSVKESTTITHTNQTLHYSGKYFIGGKMVEGQNEGNGYAKITYVGKKPRRKTTKLNNVRYIKNCISNSSYGINNHWLELQAIKDGINIAKGKSVIGTTSQDNSYPYSRITDGDITISNWARPSSNTTNQCITVDLGSTYDLDEVAVWNYFGDQRRYYDNYTYVSDNNSTWTKVIDEAIIESSNGHRINAYTDTLNGYVQDGLTLWYDGYANTGTTRNNTTTTWKDLSGTGNNVTVSGATWDDKYLSFDGTNDYAYKTSGAIYNISKEHTIEVVLKPEKRDASYQMIFSTVNSGTSVQQYGSLWISKTYQIGYDFGNASSTYSTTRMDYTTSDVGKILSYTSTRNDRTYKLYKNNLLQKNLNFDFDARTPNPAIYVGGQYNYFKGKIYSIRVYNNELTEEQLLHNYEYDKQKFNLE